MADRNVKNDDSYSSKLAKLIPAEVSAAYLAINTLVDLSNGWDRTMLASLIVLTVFCPLYLWKLQNVRNLIQIIFTTAAFPLWALNISYARFGSPELQAPLGAALILATLLIPFISPTQEFRSKT
jgi:hypothetical protein